MLTAMELYSIAYAKQLAATGTASASSMQSLLAIIDRLSAPPSAGEWKLVPTEPTREMWTASGDVLVKRRLNAMHHDLVSDAVWRAMLAAAPPAPTPPGRE